MVAVLDVSQRDWFQIITERPPGRLRFDPNYLDIDRDEGFVLVGITLSAGRTTDAKQAFYRRLNELLADRTRMRTENLAVIMLENEREDRRFSSSRQEMCVRRDRLPLSSDEDRDRSRRVHLRRSPAGGSRDHRSPGDEKRAGLAGAVPSLSTCCLATRRRRGCSFY